jgi:hypothetical protein
MSKNNKVKWWIDAILFAGFLLVFFMDLTGLELHQWLGICVAMLAAYHLLSHLDWVNAVADRFFIGTSNRSRLYLLIDIGLLCGFALILGTGLLMSTWFNLSLVNYDFWLLFHILFSLGTLILVTLKMAMHWRWIAATIRKSQPTRVAIPSRPIPVQVPAGASRVGRREFLGVLGVVGIGTLVAANSVLKGLRFIQDPRSTVLAQDLPTTTQVSSATPANADNNTATSESITTTAPTATSVPASPTTATTCVVRCNYHCSYPGRCRKYVDLNGNNLCDNGECL